MKDLNCFSWRKSSWSFIGWNINNIKILPIDEFFNEYNWFKYVISTPIFYDKRMILSNLWHGDCSDYIIYKICKKLDKLENN